MNLTPEQDMALLRQTFRTLQSGDVDACARTLTENFIANLPGAPGPLYGREIWKRGVQSMFEGFPDLRIHIEEMFGLDDKVVVRVHFRGTHQGTFQGIEATRRPVSYGSIEIYRFEDDKIAEEWVAPDMLTLMRQISADAGDAGDSGDPDTN